MKTVGQLIDQPIPQSRESHGPKKITAEMATMVNMIFVRFEAIYTNRFKSKDSAYADPKVLTVAKKEWAFSLEGYSKEAIGAAISKCKKMFEWPPTIAEFLPLLKPSKAELGMSETRQAYEEACSVTANHATHNWSHPAVYFAGKATDWYVLQTYPTKMSYPLFSANYDKVCERVQNGEDLSIPIPKAIADQSQDTYFFDAESFAEKHSIEVGLAMDLLFYTTKPKGSPTRTYFRLLSVSKLKELQIDITLEE